MHIVVTDVLTCPRCGPEFGLIVLADRMDEQRRVVEGRLGCPNCREAFPIEEGVPDLRGQSGDPLPGGGTPGGPDRALRLAALLGLSDAPGLALLLGAGPSLAAEVASLLPKAQVVAGGAEPGPAGPVSWIRHGARLPLRDRSVWGAALVGGAGWGVLDEVARVLRPGGHLVLDPAPDGARAELEKRGFSLLLEQEGVVVASLS